MGTFHRSCAKVRGPSELRFGLVHALGWGIAVLDGGPRRARERGGLGDCSPMFTIIKKAMAYSCRQFLHHTTPGPKDRGPRRTVWRAKMWAEQRGLLAIT